MRLIDADKIVYSWQIDADGQEHDGVTLESIIDKMPTIEPPYWIPVGVRVPEVTESFTDCEGFDNMQPFSVYTCYESKSVLASTSKGVYTAIYCIWEYDNGTTETEWRDNMHDGGDVEIKGVTAWQPLPEPYKESTP